MLWPSHVPRGGDEARTGGSKTTLWGGSGPQAHPLLAMLSAVRAGGGEAFFPGYGAHRSRDAAFVRWPEDPWTLTGYSTPAPGDVTRVGPRLAAGLGGLRFAGEHASWSFFGYMEGGLGSGARLAYELAAEDGLAVKLG